VRRRLLVSYLALTVVVLAALEIPLAVTYQQRQRDQLESDLVRDAFVIGSYVEDTLEGTEAVDLQALVDGYQDRTGGRAVIVNATGQLVVDSDPTVEGPRSFASRPEIEAALGSEIAVGTRSSATLGTDLLYVAVPITSGGDLLGAVRLTYSTAELDERVRSYWLLLGGVAAVSLGIAALLGVLLARWVTRPVEQLRTAATAIGEGALDTRAPTDVGPPEIRELARAFNTTASRLSELVGAQEQFVADASHELRTPLTALRLRLEMLEGDADADLTADLAGAQTEVRRLSRLVDGLLALARADRAPTAGTEVLVAGDLLQNRAEVWEPVATEQGVAIEAAPSELRVRATADRVDQMLDNLLANALEAAPPGSVVVLSARRRSPDGLVELHVVDAGPGLDAEQRRRAFDRFWRATTTRTALGGSGLGLAIVAKLAVAEGGWAELREAPTGGVDAVVVLPAAT
jgi:signal transduction histidine kinase